MKPPRPPLNRSEPKTNLFGRSKLRPLFDEPEAAIETTTPVETDAEDMSDILEAPFDNPTHVAQDTKPDPIPEPTPQPELQHQTENVPTSDDSPSETALDIPPVISELKPPPEATPPARTHKTPAKPNHAVSPQKVRPEKVSRKDAPSSIVLWGLSTFASLLWACGLAAFAFGAQSDLAALTYEPFKIVVLIFLAIFPTGLIFATAFALRNAAILSRQADRAAQLADTLLAPAASAAAQTGDLVTALREQVDHAVRAVRLAHADISALSIQLKTETERLNSAAENARAATQNVTQSLHHEREAISALSDSLGSQTTGIIEAVDRQARMVADASDLAQTQLREAEASLAASTGAVVNAAADVADAARTASEDLDRQTVRLETAGSGVTDQVRTVEEGLSQQRAGLVSAA
ncbi:MAG TPA: tipN, partial [Asticcacaulis sp.]|nr:tipN [Asticcacaulis sp.]